MSAEGFKQCLSTIAPRCKSTSSKSRASGAHNLLRRQQGATNKSTRVALLILLCSLADANSAAHLHSSTSGSLLLTKLLLSYVATN